MNFFFCKKIDNKNETEQILLWSFTLSEKTQILKVFDYYYVIKYVYYSFCYEFKITSMEIFYIGFSYRKICLIAFLCP